MKELNFTLEKLRALQSGGASWMHMDDVAKLLEDAIAMQELIDRLPRTADDVPVVPGMELYSVIALTRNPAVGLSQAKISDDEEWNDEQGIADSCSHFYSTREACQAAIDAIPSRGAQSEPAQRNDCAAE